MAILFPSAKRARGHSPAKVELGAGLAHPLDHDLRIPKWDVPKANEGPAHKLILEEAQRALARMRPLSPASRFDVGFMA
jgi:hypothetical protein